MVRITNPREYVTKALLCDGTPVCIRAIRSGDKDKLTEHFHQLKSDSRYHRFFGFRKALTPHELMKSIPQHPCEVSSYCMTITRFCIGTGTAFSSVPP